MMRETIETDKVDFVSIFLGAPLSFYHHRGWIRDWIGTWILNPAPHCFKNVYIQQVRCLFWFTSGLTTRLLRTWVVNPIHEQAKKADFLFLKQWGVG